MAGLLRTHRYEQVTEPAFARVFGAVTGPWTPFVDSRGACWWARSMDSPYPALLVPSLRVSGVERAWSYGPGLGPGTEDAQLLVLEVVREPIALADLGRLEDQLHKLAPCHSHRRFECPTHVRTVHALQVER